jgi:FkbM family methyltransferase
VTVSVVIVCENHASFLAEAMESVVSQTHPDVELVVVDTGSTDRTANVAQSVVRAHPEARIELVSLPEAHHPAQARNRGIQVAHGDYLLCLSPYDGLPPEFVERCAAELDLHPEAGFAYTDHQDLASEAYFAVREYDFEALTSRNFLGLTALFRRRAWEAAGGFDAAMPYDDWDFWIGCADAGHHGIKVEGMAWHNRNRTNGRRRSEALREVRRTHAMLVRKRPHLYAPGQHAWAEVVMARQPVSDEPMRSFTTLAFAEELTANPGLLRAYAAAFGPGDDATLLISGEGVVPLVTELGLDGPDGPDIRTHSGRVFAGVGVAKDVRALLSATDGTLVELSGIARYDAETIGGLRSEAERCWRVVNGGVPQLHADFVSAGQLVLQVGARTGDVTANFLRLGARVIAVEPNAACAETLRERFGGRDDVTVIEQAVGSWEGTHESAWAQRNLVRMTTLARIIETHGAPVFCTVEPDGFADHVLAGLDRPLPGVAFRFTPATITQARLCAWRLAALGMTEFNYTVAGSGTWASMDWMNTRTLYSALNVLETEGFEWAQAYSRPWVRQPDSSGAMVSPASFSLSQ